MSGNENTTELTAEQWRPNGKWALLNCYSLFAGRVCFKKSSIAKVVLYDARQAPSFLVRAADREGTAADKTK